MKRDIALASPAYWEPSPDIEAVWSIGPCRSRRASRLGMKPFHVSIRVHDVPNAEEDGVKGSWKWDIMHEEVL